MLVLEISAVVVALAIVAIAVATVRAMRRIERATDQASKLSEEIRAWLGEARELTGEARETLSSVRGAIAPLRKVAERLETLGGRTADVSEAVLGEIEAPVYRALAVARVAKSVTSYVLKLLTGRFTRDRSTKNGGVDDPGER